MGNQTVDLGPGHYKFTYVDLCRNCAGKGVLVPEDRTIRPIECNVCEGAGRVIVTKLIQVIVKPYTY